MAQRKSTPAGKSTSGKSVSARAGAPASDTPAISA